MGVILNGDSSPPSVKNNSGFFDNTCQPPCLRRRSSLNTRLVKRCFSLTAHPPNGPLLLVLVLLPPLRY